MWGGKISIAPTGKRTPDRPALSLARLLKKESAPLYYLEITGLRNSVRVILYWGLGT